MIKIRVLTDNNTKSDLGAEWGLCAHILHNEHQILLDTGKTGLFLRNAEALGIDLSAVETGVLSHAHYDHADGLPVFFAANSHAPFWVRSGAGEDCYRKRKVLYKYIGIRRGTLRRYADRIRLADGVVELYDGAYLLPHTSAGLADVGKEARMYRRCGLRMVPDDFAHEQSLVLRGSGGLVIFNSCSHAGVDVIIRETAERFPGERIAAVIGGFHLHRSSDEQVLALAGRLKQAAVGSIFTGHCTGQRAFDILRQELGDSVCQLYAGMEINID